MSIFLPIINSSGSTIIGGLQKVKVKAKVFFFFFREVKAKVLLVVLTTTLLFHDKKLVSS